MRISRPLPTLLVFLSLFVLPTWLLSRQEISPSQSHRNLGKAHYEQGEYDRAAVEFLEVLRLEDGTARDHFNAGMALLQSGDYDRALGSFTTAQQLGPDLPMVDFGFGVLHKRLQRYPDALRALQRVAARDPDDPCTWFNIGAVYFSMNRFEEAKDAFGKVLAMGFPAAQNFYVSSLYRQATLLSRQDQGEEAKELFANFQQLRERVPSVSLTPSALENGKYAAIVIPLPSEDAPASRQPATPVFSATGSLRFADSPCDEPPIVAQGDYDGDGDVDLFFTNPCGPGHLLRNGGEGSFTDVTREAGLGEPPPGVNAVFVDHENQGFPSLLILGETGSRLYTNREGRFTDESDESGLRDVAVGRGSSAVVFDFDHDGRLDLFLTRVIEGDEEAGRVHLYRNGAEGTFDDVSLLAGLRSLVSADWGAADFADFDNDGFSDILLVGRGASALLLRNQLGERFLGLPLALGSTMRGADSPTIQVEDFDQDGWLEAMVSGEGGYAILMNRQGERLEPTRVPRLAPHGRGGALAIDANADGWIDLLFQDAAGTFHLIGYRSGTWEEIAFEPVADAVGRLVDGDLDPSGIQLLLAGADGSARLYQRTSPAQASWLRVHLKGDRSNRQGVGAVLEAKAGNFYQKRRSRGLPMTIFTGGLDRLDVLRVTWSNAIIQNELEVDTPQRLEIIESDRQTSSCPFLYIWDGSGFRFLTDVVGRAPLGERLPDGTLLRPNPEDYVRIPPNTMKSKDGRYDFQLTEELRELAYLDALELLVVDHPVGTEVYADERFSGPPFADFRLYSVAERRAPVSATDDLGQDLLPTVSRRDAIYTQTKQGPIPGIVEEQSLILDPGALPEGAAVRLFLSGWVYWANSSAMRALSSARVPFHPPQLQVRDHGGQWVTVIEDLGLPSGIDRTLVADLTGKFLSQEYGVRIVTNLDVHWDEAFFSIEADNDSPSIQRLGPAAADLHYRGFSRVVRERGSAKPDFFDYSRVMPIAPWNAAPGLYSSYGDVLGVITDSDDQQVVMAPGDEMTVSFDARAVASAPPGRRRDFFLRITGWAKDNEPTTMFFDRVEPLPFIGMSTYGETGSPPQDHDHRRRRVPRLIPPLAPILPVVIDQR